MESPMMHEQPSAKRMAFSSRFGHFPEPSPAVDEAWPLTIDTSMRASYVPVDQPDFLSGTRSYLEQLDSEPPLHSSTSGRDTPSLVYASSCKSSVQASPMPSRNESVRLSVPQHSVAIQPRADPLHRPPMSIPSPYPVRSGNRTKSRGPKATESKLEPTWRGFINSTYEALQLLEGCLQGQFRHMPRRAYDREREEVIQSGHVFVFEENASGIKRWTDGVAWSPSRLLPNFLIYREVEAKDHQPGEKKRAIKKRKRSVDETQGEYDEGQGEYGALVVNPNDVALTIPEPERRRLCGSLTDSYNFKSDGLVKKTISVDYKGNVHHIIAYYKLEDVIYGRLSRMQDDAKLRDIHPRFELLNSHKFQGNPDNPMDDPIRYCRQADFQHQPWLQYPNMHPSVPQPSQHAVAPSDHPSSFNFYLPSQHSTVQDGFWSPHGGGQWQQQTPVIQTFTPLSNGPHHSSPQRTDCASQNMSPMTPIPYTGAQLSQYQPTTFSPMVPAHFNNGGFMAP